MSTSTHDESILPDAILPETGASSSWVVLSQKFALAGASNMVSQSPRSLVSQLIQS